MIPSEHQHPVQSEKRTASMPIPSQAQQQLPVQQSRPFTARMFEGMVDPLSLSLLQPTQFQFNDLSSSFEQQQLDLLQQPDLLADFGGHQFMEQELSTSLAQTQSHFVEQPLFDSNGFLSLQQASGGVTPTPLEVFDLHNDLALFSSSPELGLSSAMSQPQPLLPSPVQMPSHRIYSSSLINLALQNSSSRTNSVNGGNLLDLYPDLTQEHLLPNPDAFFMNQQDLFLNETETDLMRNESTDLLGSLGSAVARKLTAHPQRKITTSHVAFPKCPPVSSSRPASRPASRPGSQPGSRAGSRASSPTKEYKRVRVPREQMQWLKEIYDINPYPSQEELESISSDIGLSVRKVRVWFQNRRTRQRARNGTSEAKVEEDDDE